MKRNSWEKIPTWLKFHVFYRADLTSEYNVDDVEEGDGVQTHPFDANLITSKKHNGKHSLLLDLDQESYVVESSTPGHRHVYIDMDLDLEALEEIVSVLTKHGVLQEGIQQQLTRHGFLGLRVPGTVKGTPDDYGPEAFKQQFLEVFDDGKAPTEVKASEFKTYPPMKYHPSEYFTSEHSASISVELLQYACSPEINWTSIESSLEPVVSTSYQMFRIKIPASEFYDFITNVGKSLGMEFIIKEGLYNDSYSLYYKDNIVGDIPLSDDDPLGVITVILKQEDWPCDVDATWPDVVNLFQKLTHN